LFDFGGRSANREASQRLLSAALASHDAKLQEVLDDLIAAYFDATKLSTELEATQQARMLAASTLEATRRRESNGVASHNDTLQAQVAFAKADLAEKRVFGSYSKAVALLRYSMGTSPEGALSLPDLQSPTAMTIGELSQWLQLAESQHPSLIAARHQWEAMTRKVTVARSEGRPTLDFTANLFQNGYPNQGIQTTSTRQTTFGLTINVPLFEGFARTYKVQEADAQANVAQAQYKDTEYQVLMSVVKAHADAVAAGGTLEACETLLAASLAAVDSSERRYAGGAANILELLTAQSNLADAREQHVQCLSDWFAGRLRLMTSAGILGLTRLQHAVADPAEFLAN
jgi:outer membrane protein